MAAVQAHPLLVFGALLLVGAIAASATRRMRLPGLTGYVGVGLAAAALGEAVLTPGTVSLLRFFEQLAGAAVLFGIGSRLSLGALRTRLRSIAWMVGLTLSASLALAVIVLVASLSGALDGVGLSILEAATVGLALVAASPTVIAFVSYDEGADGPSTRMVLAASALLDFTIVVLVIALALLAPVPMTGGVSASVSFLPQLAAALVAGGAIGALLAAYGPRPPALVAAGIGAGYMALAAIGAHDQLALMAGALAAGVAYANVPRTAESRGSTIARKVDDADARDPHPRLFDRLGLSVLFVTAGALTEVHLLASVVPLALLLVVVRAIAVFAGATAAGWLADDREVRTLGFASLLPQAGFSLLLLSALSHPTPMWHALLLLVVLVNEIVMPPFLRRAIERSGEGRLDRAPLMER